MGIGFRLQRLLGPGHSHSVPCVLRLLSNSPSAFQTAACIPNSGFPFAASQPRFSLLQLPTNTKLFDHVHHPLLHTLYPWLTVRQSTYIRLFIRQYQLCYSTQPPLYHHATFRSLFAWHQSSLLSGRPERSRRTLRLTIPRLHTSLTKDHYHPFSVSL